LSSPYLWGCFHPQTPLLVVSTTKEILLNMGLKCWNSTFNAQGSRLLIIIVHVKTMRIYVTIVEVFMKKERRDEIQFTTKIDGFLSFTPRWILMFFSYIFLISPQLWSNSRFWSCVFLTLQIYLISKQNYNICLLYCNSRNPFT
jgi:hypothetical protein